MIRFDHVFKRYPNGREALHDVSFDVRAGEFVFLTGRSGAGKSSVLKLMTLLERRLDNVVHRLGFAASRAQARQLVRHGHFHVNGRRVNIPSYQVRTDDIVSLRPGAAGESAVRSATDLTASVANWLQADNDNLTGKVLRMPDRDEIDTPVQEQLIVELYSK